MTIDTYVLFELAGTTYGIPSTEVAHIEMLEHITLVPGASPAMEGVVFSRGQVIPVLNLRLLFGSTNEPRTLRSRLIVVQREQRTVGLIVDSAREFRKIPAETIRPIEDSLSGINANYLRAIASLGDRLILLLDLGAVLQADVSSKPLLPAGLGAPLPLKRELSSHR
jgi:purine-binding chemotaxis protein CheW